MSGAEKGTLQTNSCQVEWKIDRFFGDCQNVGDYYTSPFLSIRHPNKLTNWFFKVFPKGECQESKEHIALYISFRSETKLKLTVTFQALILNEKNLPEINKEIAVVMGRSGASGWKRFRRIDYIKDPELKILTDDKLSILCQVIFRAGDQKDLESFHGYNKLINKIDCGLGEYEQILESGNFTDVTFNVQHKNINAHKNILSCRSPVFKAMFEHEMKENEQNTVDIMDIDYHVMMELLRFLYSGRVKNMDKIASDLLLAADKYQVVELKALCEKNLYDELTVNNAVECLKLSEMCDTIYLKNLVIKFIAKHYRVVARRSEFVDLQSTQMHQIILAIGEID